MICPRCNLNQIPNNETPGKYPGALSRVDNKTEICSACGTDEAARYLLNRKHIKIDKWPVKQEDFILYNPTQKEI